MSVSLELPGGVKVLNAVDLDPRNSTTTLAAITNDATYKIGFSPIYNEEDGITYIVSGGDATGGWEFSKLAPEAVDGLPTGGITGQVLVKQSDADGDVDWINATDYSLFTVTPSENAIALDFDADKISNDYIIDSANEIQKGTGAHKPGKIIQLIMVADGNAANKPTFTTDFSLRSDNWDNTNGVKNIITMKYLNSTSKIIIDYAKL